MWVHLHVLVVKNFSCSFSDFNMIFLVVLHDGYAFSGFYLVCCLKKLIFQFAACVSIFPSLPKKAIAIA